MEPSFFSQTNFVGLCYGQLMRTTFAPHIIRAYDMRGRYGRDLFDHDAYLLAKKMTTYLRQRHLKAHYTIVLARDGRKSSPPLAHALKDTFIRCGMDVLDIGVVPSPLAYFVSKTQNVDGVVIVTASHNPKEDNGFKLLANNTNIFSDELHYFSGLPLAEDGPEQGNYTQRDFNALYLKHNLKCLQEVDQKLSIAWDFAHGAMAAVAPLIKEMLPGKHIFLNDTVDGSFPAHPPDPSVASNMTQLCEAVLTHHCDLGIAFDGDGDRLGVIDHTGAFIEGDRLTAILSQDVLNKHPGAQILMDIKSSRACLEQITRLGGKPELTRTGHSFIKVKLLETGAPMAGEMSGHMFFADENYGYDDGLYAALRLIRFLNNSPHSLHELNAAFPRYPVTPEVHLPCDGKRKFMIVDDVKAKLKERGIIFRDDDGVRVESDDGFWLLRASNTSDYLVFRAEGKDEAALQRQQDLFKEIYVKLV